MLRRTAYSLCSAGRTTSTGRPSTRSADIVKENLSPGVRHLSPFLAQRPLKRGTIFTLPSRQVRSEALSNIDAVAEDIFRRFGCCAPLTLPIHSPTTLTTSTPLSPATNLLSVPLLVYVRPYYQDLYLAFLNFHPLACIFQSFRSSPCNIIRYSSLPTRASLSVPTLPL